jgi:hypothetical protein
MRAVSRRTFTLIVAGFVSLCSTASHADEREDATAAAKAFFAALAEKKFDLIWDTLASGRYKNDMANTKEGFIAHLTILRRQIGRLTSSTVLNFRYDAPDPRAAFKGKSYIFAIENVYTTGTRVEYVVIVEENGQFKMQGMALG